MNNYLFIDNENTIPLITVVAEDKLDALCKYIKGLIKDEILSLGDICDSLNIELREFSDLKNYE